MIPRAIAVTMFIVRVAVSIPITLAPITLPMFWVILDSLITVIVSASGLNHACRESGYADY